MAKIPSAPSPSRFATVWVRELERAVRAVSGSTRVTRAQAERIGEDDPARRVYRDNVLNYLDAHGYNSVRLDRLFDSARRHAQSEGERVAGGNNRVSLTEARRMALDLRDDFRVLRGRAPEGAAAPSSPSAREVLAPLDDAIGALAEWWDSGDNGVNVTSSALVGAATLDEALGRATQLEPWTAGESNVTLAPEVGADAVAAFVLRAESTLDAFRDEEHPEVRAFGAAVSGAFGGLEDVRFATGRAFGGLYLLGKTADGYAVVTVQAYRDA